LGASGTRPSAISCNCSCCSTLSLGQTSANIGASINFCRSRAGSSTTTLGSNTFSACASRSCIDGTACSSCFSAISWKISKASTIAVITILSNSWINIACVKSVITVICGSASSLSSTSACGLKGASTSSVCAAISGSAISRNFSGKWASIYASVTGCNISPRAERVSCLAQILLVVKESARRSGCCEASENA